MRLGFVGTGTITAAIVEGLFRRRDDIEAVYLSPRNRDTADRLAGLDGRIKIANDNQSVLDRSEVVVLAVRPQIAREVVTQLNFQAHHHVISAIATIDLATLQGWLGPVRQITRALPLPFVAVNAGVTALYQPDPSALDLFTTLGTAIEVKSEAEFETFFVGSALMGTYFQLMGDCCDWLSAHGLAAEDARAYLRTLFSGLAQAAANSPDKDFLGLRDEFSTPGGINEQVATAFREEGGSHALSSGLEAVRRRISAASLRKIDAGPQ